MKFITNLFAPRWKHKNPQVRKQALLALDATREETQTILQGVAKDDPELFIRRLAIKRLTGIDAVQTLRQGAPREEIHQEATRRLCVLLSAEDGAADFAQLRSRLEQLTEAGILEYVAKHARIPELQRHALDRVDNENVLVDVITGSEQEAIRHYALGKLNTAAALKRVIKLLKRKDKQLATLAQEKLDSLNASLAQRNELVSDYQRIGNDFLELVELCKLSNEWPKYATRLRSLHEQWRGMGLQLDTQANRHEYEQTQRVNLAFAFFEEALKHAIREQVWEVVPQVTPPDVIGNLRDLNLQVVEKLKQIRGLDSQQPLDCTGLDEYATGIKQQWRQYYKELTTAAGVALAAADLAQTKAEFEANLAELEQWRADAPVLQNYHAQLNELIAAARNLLDSEHALTSKDITRLEKRFEKIPTPKLLSVDDQLMESYKITLQDLQQALARRDDKRRSIMSEVATLNIQLADAVAEGQSKQASHLINRGKKLLKQLDDAGNLLLEKNGELGRFNQLAQQLAELQGWRQWSSTPVKEQQISDMLELARELEANKENPHYDFVAAANGIKAARKQWQNLTAGEPAGDQALWQRFDAACNQAYAVCQQYFDQQTAQRARNLQQRELFCQDLETYHLKIAGQAVDSIDWKTMQKIIQAARKDWRQIGMVDRSNRAEIDQRYNQVIQALEKRLRGYQQQNRDTKELLIKRVQTLAKQLTERAVSIEQAIESVKQVQAEWKATGAVVKEAQLWRQFREACDAVFQVQRAEQDAVNQARDAEKQQRGRLIEAVEAAGKLTDEALLQARTSVEKAKSEWAELPRLKKDDNLERRFSRACERFDKQLALRHAQQLRVQKQNLQHNVALCHELEKALFACLRGEGNAGLLQDCAAGSRQRWLTVDSRLRRVDQAVSERFEQLKAYAEQCAQGNGEAIWSQIAAQADTCEKIKELLCIQMEILANIESPPESRQRRMEYQVGQLARKMKQSESRDTGMEIEQLLVQWQRSGVMEPGKAERLEQRFYSVLQLLDKDYQ
ncbi:MAG TPA: DUF349 domain-containing protein [Gammaproteobacteria bacterium]